MKAIFINAKEATVTYVENRGELEELYSVLGVEMVEIGKYWDNGDHLYVDEEGLLNGTTWGFTIDGTDFVGNGLIYGIDLENPSAEGPVASKLEDHQIKFWVLAPSMHLDGQR